MFLAAAAPSDSHAQITVDRDRDSELASRFAPPVDLWLDQVSYDRGARMRPYFTTEPGAYVVVVRVTSDGELRVMYPGRPRDQRPFVLGQFTNDRMPSSGDPSLNLYESSGTGFVFAIASYKKFDLSYFVHGSSWNGARLASFGRYGDPFEIVRSFVDRILPQTADYSLDYELYEVYSRGRRSAYSSGIYGSSGYWALDDYHNACLSAFGVRYSYYCRSYRGGYYGPIIIAGSPRTPNRPNSPNPRGKSMKPPRGLGDEPIVPRSPIKPDNAQGIYTERDAADRAEREYERRLRAKSQPSGGQVEGSTQSSNPRFRYDPRFGNRRGSETQPVETPRAPVIYRSMPQRERSEPRAPPRTEQPQRSEPRARAEPRSEPRAPAGTQAPRERRYERPRSDSKAN